MFSELDLLLDVAGRLEQAGLDYMLTGSMALNHYAQPRMTRDIEFPSAKHRRARVSTLSGTAKPTVDGPHGFKSNGLLISFADPWKSVNGGLAVPHDGGNADS